MSAADDTLSADGGPRLAGVRARLVPGDVLGNRYELAAELGHGAFGTVFRARDRVAGIDVAIKVLGRGAVPLAVPPERLSRELRAAWTVTHANVVRIHDVIVADDRVALSMELVDGETLAARVARSGALPLGELLPLARGLAAGLAAAHAAGVVHRDLKPSNVLLRRGDLGAPAIADFGLSRLVGEAGGVREETASEPRVDRDLTQTGDLLGTPAFMAPEQLRGDTGAVGPAADIYAFGLVMYEAATGMRAHHESTLPELVRARLDRPARPVSLGRGELPVALAQVIDACLAIDPAARIADGVALAARLAPAVAPTRRRAWIAIAAVGALAVAAGVIASIATRAPHRELPPAVAIRVSDRGPIAFSAVVPGTMGAIVQRAIREPDGTRYLAGHTTASFAIGNDATHVPAGLRSGFLIALAPDGAPRWHREIAGDKDIQLVDAVRAGELVVVVGNTHGAVDLGEGVHLPMPARAGADCYLAAFDAKTGAARWAHACGATGTGQGRTLVADARGNIYASGEFAGEARFSGATPAIADPVHRSLFVASYAPDGALRWVTTSGASAIGGGRGFALAFGTDELLFGGTITGATTLGTQAVAADDDGDAFVAALDPATGAVRAVRVLGGDGGLVESIAVAGDDVVVGGTFSGAMAGLHLTSAGSTDVFVAALSPGSGVRWAVRGGGEHFDGLRGLALAPDKIVVTGRFDVDFAFGDHRATAANGSNIFVAELDRATGAARTLRAFGGHDADKSRSIEALPDGSIGLTGTFRDTFVIGEARLPAASTTNGFALELRP